MNGGKRTSRRRASLLAALCLLAAPAAASAQEAGQKEGVRRPPAVNVKPFKDFLAEGKRLLDGGELGSQTTFDSTITGELDASGSLKLETIESRHKASDVPAMKLAAYLLNAISQSRILSVLDGAKVVRLSIKLDEHAFSATASSELESEEKASQYVKGYGLLLEVGRAQKKGTREAELYSGLSLASEGRRFTMKLELPRETAVRLFSEVVNRAAAGAGRN